MSTNSAKKKSRFLLFAILVLLAGPVTTYAQKTWAGTTSNWSTAGNWSPSGVPAGTDDVIIPAGQSAYPNISTGTAAANDITINSGGSLAVSGTGVLQIAGAIANSGTFTASSGGITLNGTSSQTLSGSAFNGGTANTIEDLVISNTAGVSISSALNIAATGSLTVNSGSTLTTNGNLTLQSTNIGTARVANSAGTVSGNVKVQRYIPGRRAFRILSHPFTSSQPLSILTDDIDITGPGAGANGFEWSLTNNPSAYWYNEATADGDFSQDAGWTAFTNTNGAGANAWRKGQGIRVLIRGAKGQGLNGQAYTPSAVTLDMTGVLNQGSQVISVTRGPNPTAIYYLVGNPFHCQVDMNQTVRTAGINNFYYIWNAQAGTRGSFEAKFYSNSYILPAGAGFWTGCSANGTITFSENTKTASAPSSILKTTSTTDQIDLKLYSDTLLWDGLQVYFDQNSGVDSEMNDAPKMRNPDVDFYTLSSDNKKLAIDTRPYSKDTAIALGLVKAPAGVYTIKAEDFHMQEGTNAYLHDKRTSRKEQITEGFAYSFTIADSLDQGENRFELLFDGDPVTGVANAVVTGMKVNINPNPASSQMNISYELPSTRDVAVVVTDMNGAIVYQGNAGSNRKGNVTIDVQRWAQGIYLVKLTAGNESTTQRFIKK